MQTEKIEASLKDILSLHEDLLQLSFEKKDILIKGDTDQLRVITGKEQKFIKAIQKKDQELQLNCNNFLGSEPMKATLNDVIKMVDDQTKEILIEIKQKLVEVLGLIKTQNDTNQQLINQSLQFIEVSLDLLKPDIDTYNYNRSETKNPYPKEGFSIFESKI
ncbi:flagellar protein FlgN [Niallia circulans]|uniref:flagellar protein FlgN n=1 Tax=Niallia circulans TaxID=1397 RepID=UPI00155FAAD9|nr:flagellar protein FlgN [Niallia circulans]MCM2981950.1 flagellar protein FlgN [Niallia circulans]NRG33206.1 flagellar protein FlgN [Niallia circulans]